MMDSFMNEPVEKEFTYEDVMNAYNRSGDNIRREIKTRKR